MFMMTLGYGLRSDGGNHDPGVMYGQQAVIVQASWEEQPHITHSQGTLMKS